MQTVLTLNKKEIARFAKRVDALAGFARQLLGRFDGPAAQPKPKSKARRRRAPKPAVQTTDESQA